MTVYTVFFVTPDGSTPDFDVAEFASLSEACAAASMMMERKSKPCDAEIFADGRRIGVLPGMHSVSPASSPVHVALSTPTDIAVRR